jgi:hypothetical protein
MIRSLELFFIVRKIQAWRPGPGLTRISFGELLEGHEP